MDYIQEYIALMKSRISDLEVQVAILRSMLPNPPPPTTQPPHPQPKHQDAVNKLTLHQGGKSLPPEPPMKA